MNSNELQNRRLRTPDAAQYVGLSQSTMEKARLSGTGPRYSKLGKAVVYAIDDLEAWTRAGLRSSTSDTKRQD